MFSPCSVAVHDTRCMACLMSSVWPDLSPLAGNVHHTPSRRRRFGLRAGNQLRTLSILLAIGCAGAQPAPSRIDRSAARDWVSGEEITASQATNMAEAIRLLRPTWLRARGPQSIRSSVSPYPVVYVDGIRMGEPQWLRDIPCTTVLEARFIGAADATTRWGTGHATGVILVTTRR